jgi:probable metal-binding protein
MAEQIHGHEVMQMLIDLNEPQSKVAFKEEIETKFGAEARFYTCSADNLSSAELIEFLDKKGKFFYSDDGKFTTNPGQICNH